MIIARKLLIPTLAIFLAILVALGVFFAIDYSQGVAAQARRDLDGLEQALQSDLQSRAALASALAASNANSQNVQAAFAASGAKIACICSSDAVYEERAEATARALHDAGAVRVYLAGRHEATGVDEHVYTGCDALSTLTRALDALADK